jgi:type 2 lantibiotic biosynthesis protein LanM
MHSKWKQAYHFDEYFASLPFPPGPSSELSARRFQRWKSSPAFTKDEQRLSQFLAQWQANEEDLNAVLSDGETILAEAPWEAELKAAFETEGHGEPKGIDGYLHLVWPLISRYRDRMAKELAALAQRRPGIVESELVLAAMLETALAKLRRQLQRALVLETNIARVEGRLSGATPADRFENFVQSLRSPSTRLSILQEYPLLARDCVRILSQWLDANTEFLHRYEQDAATLAVFFGLSNLGSLQRLTGNAGDAHRNGRSVCILDFSSGAKLVYKPRSLSADAGFQTFLEWINGRGQSPKLRTYRVLDRGDHGWAEFVPFAPCQSEEELKDFYRRQGSLVALLYALGTTDMHLENVIASGAHPVVIDLETIFHPRFRGLGNLDFAEDIANERFFDSVMSIGLLPSPVRGGGRTIDKSGLGATRNMEAPAEVDGLEGIGTDEVKVGKVPGRVGEIFSQPSLSGTSPDVHRYREQVQEGFSKTYRMLAASKADLLAPEGPLEKFRHVTIRAVLRPSATYAALLTERTHPKLLRQGFSRELLFSQIWEEVNRTEAYAIVTGSERAQLWRGDIPYFTTKPGSYDLRGGDELHMEGALSRSGFDVARDRIARLGPQDEAYQSWLIDAAFSSTDIVGTFTQRQKPYRHAESFLEAAVIIGERLAETAVRKNGTATWPCLVYDSGGADGELGSYRVGIADYGLYRGHAGIALFLAQLGMVSGKAEFSELARESIATMLKQRDRWEGSIAPGAYTGLAGHIYFFTQVGALWGDEAMLDEAESLLPKLRSLLEKDEIHDMISGSAGTIPVLLGLAALRPKSDARALAILAGDRLLETSELKGTTPPMITWSSLSMPRGFSHGASGIAFALSELAAATGEEKYQKGAEAALAYERTLLASGDWSDVPGDGERNWWCHGAPGIAMGRLLVWNRTKDNRHLEEAKAALAAAHRDPAMRSASILCHGDLGNLETFALGSALLRDSDLEKVLQESSRAILADFNRSGWATPLPAFLSEPGIMMGLAGIGHGFLRLADPKRVPSVLHLAPASNF